MDYYAIYLIVLIAALAAIVIWTYGKKREKRFEEDARIPFQDRDWQASPDPAVVPAGSVV